MYDLWTWTKVREWWREGVYRVEENKGEKKCDECNSIINKIYFKKEEKFYELLLKHRNNIQIIVCCSLFSLWFLPLYSNRLHGPWGQEQFLIFNFFKYILLITLNLYNFLINSSFPFYLIPSYFSLCPTSNSHQFQSSDEHIHTHKKANSN